MTSGSHKVPASGQPDWSYWKRLYAVKIEQAVLLSFGIEPRSIEKDLYSSRLLLPKKIATAIQDRLNIAVSNLDNTEHLRSQSSRYHRSPKEREYKLADFARWAVSNMKWDNLPPELVAMATRAQPAPATDALPGVLVVTNKDEVLGSDTPAESATADRGWVMKKAALIAKNTNQWQTINRDFQDASENGLSKAAKASLHGHWFETDALNWARQRGKLTGATEQPEATSATLFPTTKHRIKG